MESLLEVRSLSKSFGALKVADQVDLNVYPGEVVGVIGPNGAGKTSLFSLIAGDLHADSGTISLDGERVERLRADNRAHRGIARTYQIPKPFTHMKVVDNLRVAAIFGARLKPTDAEDHVGAILEETNLTPVAGALAGTLPLLSRKRLELARALATKPRLLLVDEIAGGLTDPEVDEFVYLISQVRERSVAIVWIEHIIRAMTGATDRLVALHQGAVLAEGDPAAVFEHPEVRLVYTGT